MKCNLERVCEKHGWTVRDLKKVLQKHNICDPTAVDYWLLGKRYPRAKYVDIICTLLDCTVGELFTYDPYKFDDEVLNNIARKGR